MGEALRRGWRARSEESPFVLQTQSRREELKEEAEEEEKEVAAAATTSSFDHSRLLCEGSYCTSYLHPAPPPPPHHHHHAYDGLRRSQAYDGLLHMGAEPSPIRIAAAAQALRPALRPAQAHGPTLGPTLFERQRASVDLQCTSFAAAAAAIAVASRAATPKPMPPPAASETPIPHRPSPIAAPPSPPPRARASPRSPAPDGGFAQDLDTTSDAADEWLADYDQVTGLC